VKEMKEWKIVVSGKSESPEGTEETAKQIVRLARVAGLKVEEAQVSFGGNTSSIGLDDPGMSRESALGAANHPDPLAREASQAIAERETAAREAARRAEGMASAQRHSETLQKR